jgi:thiol-disulfide isomerase/thioredoxin
MAVDSLLRLEARAWAHVTEKDSNQEVGPPLVQAYLRSIGEQTTVGDSEVRVFYQENVDMFQGATLEQVKDDLRKYLQRERMSGVIDEHIRTISDRTLVEIDADWLKAPAAAELNNPVDRARRSGRPTVVDFGADGCGPCDMMTPILDELRAAHSGRCNVVFAHVREKPALAQRYGISSIPVQVFFDRRGREVFRHTGFYPKEQMLARLAEIGVK